MNEQSVMEAKKGTCKHGEFYLSEGCPLCIEEARRERAAKAGVPIVKVRYFTADGEAVSDREYTYYSEEALNVGDVVIVPVRDTTARAKVSQVAVPDSEIEAFKDKVKTIPAGSKMTAQPEPEPPPEVKQGITEGIEQRPEITGTALTTPDKDKTVKLLVEQAESMVKYANELVIASSDDVKDATADLALVAGLTKQLKAKRDEYVKPLQAEADKAKAFFDSIMNPVAEAYKTGKQKILDYNAEVERQIAEAKRIEDEKYRLAQEEAALKGGEITIDLTPVKKPAETPNSVRTDMGNAHKTGNWKWKVVDLSQVPREYLVVDSAMLTAIARSHHDAKPVPGIRFYFEPGLRINTR